MRWGTAFTTKNTKGAKGQLCLPGGETIKLGPGRRRIVRPEGVA